MTDYEKEWRAAGHPDGGSAEFLPPPPPGVKRVYHFTSACHGIGSVKDRRLKIARFSDTNDPFELMGLVLREETVRQAVKDFKKERNNDTGMLCFSTNWTNPLLWSHYAEKHAGVCLGFDLKEEIVRPVCYEENRLLTKAGEKKNAFVIDQDLEDRLLLTKSHHWKDEHERRIFIPLSNDLPKKGELYFKLFDRNMSLKEVILGPRCGLKLEKIREVTLATNPCAIVFRSRLEYGKFRVRVNGRDLSSIAQALTERPRECT